LAVTNVGGVAVPAEATAYGHIATVSNVTESRLVAVNTETAVREYFNDIPVMIQIARCESTFRHTLADGSVLKGVVDPADTGVMQINKRFHESRAIELGLDLHNLHDNMAYARYLYEKQGTRPWNSSAPCWSRTLAMS
jgi:hypothetical protein